MKHLINLANFNPQTQALGPGIRSVLWVQGCPFSCPGCISPEWQKPSTFNYTPVDEVARWILSNPSVSGLTISGGEPLLQARSLVELIKILRKSRDINVISYTGFTMERIMRELPRYPEYGEYLDLLDVLIDGPYIQKLDDNQGLRGSSNQRVYYLSERLNNFDFHHCQRSAEFHIRDGELLLTGVPPKGVLSIFDDVIKQQKSAFIQGLS